MLHNHPTHPHPSHPKASITQSQIINNLNFSIEDLLSKISKVQ